MLRRVIGIVVAVLLAAFGTVVLVAYVRSAEDRALEGEETVEVFVLRQDVAVGTPGAALADLVEVERIPKKVLANGVVTDLAALDGQVAAVDLLAGEQVVSQRFAAPETLGTVEVPEGLSEVTISLAPERALGGRLGPGDRVGIVASFTGDAVATAPGTAGTEGTGTQADAATGETAVDSTHLILHGVLVTGVRLQVADTDGTAEAVPAGHVFVTLAVDAPSVERIVFTAEHGTLWLSNEPEGAITAGTEIQTRETIYR